MDRHSTEVREVNSHKKMAGSSLALMLAIAFAIPATASWGQMAPRESGSVISASQSVDVLDQEVAQKISQAWSEGKDASGAVAFQENGEIALSEGNQDQARRNFEAAEHELAHLKPNPVQAPSASVY
jgi:hypothetical protein